jgi:hypothetical protein
MPANHPGVLEVAVVGFPMIDGARRVGAPDDRWGEAVKSDRRGTAPGSAVTQDEILQLCSRELAGRSK